MDEADRTTTKNAKVDFYSNSDNRRSVIIRFIDGHLREIKWTVYGFGLLGGLLVLKSVHASKQFRKITDIPRSFIEKNVTLQGRVVGIEQRISTSKIQQAQHNSIRQDTQAVSIGQITPHNNTQPTSNQQNGIGKDIEQASEHRTSYNSRQQDVKTGSIEQYTQFVTQYTDEQLNIQSSGNTTPVLWTQHQAIIKFPTAYFTKSIQDPREISLPVSIAGINCGPLLLTWLNKNLNNKHIWFCLLQDSQEKVEAIVYSRLGWRKRNINHEIVKLGLGKVVYYESLPKSKKYQDIIQQLVQLESRASIKGIGIWKEEKPSLLKTFGSYMLRLMKTPLKLLTRQKKS